MPRTRVENIGDLEKGQEVWVAPGCGNPASENERISTVCAVIDNFAALTVSGVMLNPTDYFGVFLTGNTNEGVELSKEAKAILDELGIEY